MNTSSCTGTILTRATSVEPSAPLSPLPSAQERQYRPSSHSYSSQSVCMSGRAMRVDLRAVLARWPSRGRSWAHSIRTWAGGGSDCA
eukprot:6182297-Pleurochrysis_carterae.AAC.2